MSPDPPSPDGELGREARVGDPEDPQACPSRRALRPGGTAGGGRMNAGSWVRGQGVGCSPNSTIQPRPWSPKWSRAEPGSSLPTLRPTSWGLFLECSPPLWPLATEDTGQPAWTRAPPLHAAGAGPDRPWEVGLLVPASGSVLATPPIQKALL